jgi:hypothetical protein
MFYTIHLDPEASRWQEPLGLAENLKEIAKPVYQFHDYVKPSIAPF